MTSIKSGDEVYISVLLNGTKYYLTQDTNSIKLINIPFSWYIYNTTGGVINNNDLINLRAKNYSDQNLTGCRSGSGNLAPDAISDYFYWKVSNPIGSILHDSTINIDNNLPTGVAAGNCYSSNLYAIILKFKNSNQPFSFLPDIGIPFPRTNIEVSDLIFNSGNTYTNIILKVPQLSYQPSSTSAKQSAYLCDPAKSAAIYSNAGSVPIFTKDWNISLVNPVTTTTTTTPQTIVTRPVFTRPVITTTTTNPPIIISTTSLPYVNIITTTSMPFINTTPSTNIDKNIKTIDIDIPSNVQTTKTPSKDSQSNDDKPSNSNLLLIIGVSGIIILGIGIYFYSNRKIKKSRK